MPLHIPRIFGRSRPRSTSNRTDLCSTYTITPQERRAQGYLFRSEWSWDTNILGSQLKVALGEGHPLGEGHGSIDWQEWSMERECRKIRQYHFEDLDPQDQNICPSCLDEFAELIERLRPLASAEQLSPIEGVLRQMRSFREQATQLYGAKRCGLLGPSRHQKH